MRATILPCGLLVALVAGCLGSVPRETVVEPGSVEFDIQFLRHPLSTSGMPLLSRNDAAGASHFVIDTGSETTVISPRFAARMAFPSRCTVPYYLVGADQKSRWAKGAVHIGELRFEATRSPGSASFRGFDALVADTPIFDAGVDGILGVPLLATRTWTIDYAASRLRIEDRLLDPDLPHTVPMRVTRGVIHVPVEIAGETHWALLDTGSNGFLRVPEARWAELASRESNFEGRTDGFSVTGAMSSETGQLDGSVAIAGQRIHRPFITSGPSFAVGGALLNGLVLTIDQRSRLVRVVRPAAADTMPGTP